MMNNPKPISEFLVPGKRAHLVGIGGVSMCPLAEVLAGKGLLVQGSDMTESDSVKHLRSKGISVAIGHNAENLGDCDFVIRTAAVHDGNPEIAGAIARGIPVYERAQAWGALMRKYPNALCVSGTHGKPTPTILRLLKNKSHRVRVLNQVYRLDKIHVPGKMNIIDFTIPERFQRFINNKRRSSLQFQFQIRD